MAPQKREMIKEFLTATTIIQTTPDICEKAATFRLSYALKLPDAVIAATAQYLGCPLITADAVFFNMKEIEIIQFAK